MKVHVADSSDAGTIATLILKLLDELSGDQASGCEVSVLTTRADELLADQSIIALLAIHDESVIGVLVLNPCSSLYAGRFGEITELFVEPEFRSSGAGAALVAAAVEFACQQEWSRLEVGTPELPTWQRTADFYLQNEFVPVGMRMKREFVAAQAG